MKFNKLFLLVLFSSLFFVSCDPEEDATPFYTSKGTYDSGVLVLNEGNFQTPTASISYISFDLNTYTNNIYGLANGTSLGDTGQSIGFNNDLAYIVVNNSDKIEVVNRYTMLKVGTISTGLDSPRYIAFANGKGYVTNWGNPFGTSPIAAFVAVINLTNNTVESKIQVANDPEKIIESNGKLYVAHDNYANGNTISIINAATNMLVGSPITVESGPNSLTVKNGFLWVSCSGKGSWPVAADETSGKVFKIDMATNLISKIYAFTSAENHVDKFQIQDENAFFTKGSSVYKLPLDQVSTTISTNPIFTTTAEYIYGFGISNTKAYIADGGSFTSNGKVLVYSLGGTQDTPAIGTLLKTINVGIAPNGFYFNQ